MYYAPEDLSDTSSNLMDQLAREILEEIINEEDSDLEKIKSIHDYLANHILYDPNPIAENDYKDISHTAYGALIDGVAVCDGYAEAFKYLLDKTTIENILIFGEVDEDGNFEGAVNHAWNLIKLEDGYHHYDLTWNDDDTNNKVLYEFYSKDSIFFDDTHKWNQDDYNIYLN
jgi:transglutaminase/protease-like cytokinesis protein 3